MLHSSPNLSDLCTRDKNMLNLMINELDHEPRPADFAYFLKNKMPRNCSCSAKVVLSTKVYQHTVILARRPICRYKVHTYKRWYFFLPGPKLKHVTYHCKGRDLLYFICLNNVWFKMLIIIIKSR